ncbi:MAG: glycosyltransferase [Methylocystaceae bacterium]|nr:glycosyltransferase [Methylocystaceae bacterium]
MNNIKRPLVSIITPVYNGEKYIAETIESVLAQNYENIEYIIIDDGSSDNSLTIVEKYSEKISVFSQKNQGEAAAVNKGFNHSNGDYICVVNADDPIYPKLISRATYQLESDDNLVAVYPDWHYIDEKGNIIRTNQCKEYDFRVMLEQHICIPGPGTVFKKSALKNENLRDLRYKHVTDFDLWLRLGLQGNMKRIPEVLATWRDHAEGSTSSGRNASIASEQITLIENFFARPDIQSEFYKYKAQSLSMAYYYAAAFVVETHNIPARRYLLKSFMLKFFWPKYFYSSQKRSWKLIAFIIGLPLSKALYKKYAGEKS